MKLEKLPLYIALVLIVVSCTKWQLPEKCTEALPTDISINTTDNTVTALAGTSSATWSLADASGTTVNTASGTSYSFIDSSYPNGNYTIKASGKNGCGFSFSLEKTITINTPIISIDMASIPGGTFEMGDIRNEGFSNEKPVHTVTVSGFKIGKYEITQKQYKTIMGYHQSTLGNFCDDCPVEDVSWMDAVAFCNGLSTREGKQKVYIINGTDVSTNLNANGYRLPTEAEWEYAAGGGSNNRTRFGNGKDVANSTEINFDARAFYVKPYSVAGEHRFTTTKVGSFFPNALGLYDMTGNVFEWCNDLYGGYNSNSQTNPTGVVTGIDRVIRGGSWNSLPQDCRLVSRGGLPPSFRAPTGGFRVVSL